MKKSFFIFSVLTVGMSSESFASKGYAHDGLFFMLAVAGFLLVVAGLLALISYLKRNGGQLIHRAVTWVGHCIRVLRDYRSGNSFHSMTFDSWTE